MKTIGQIRRDNLELLVKEAGTLEALAVEAGTSSVYLSQIRTQAKDTKTQRPRELGTPMARRLEAAREKPPGWMDVEHTTHESPTASSRPDELSLEQMKASLGTLSMGIAKQLAALSTSRRKTISHLFAAQIADGPHEDEAKAIDALTPGVDLVAFSQDGSKMMVCEAKPVSDWHRTALHLANAYQDDAIRPYLERFVEEVATFMANEAQPLKTEQERLTYLK